MRFVGIFISFFLCIKRNEMADVLMCVCVSDPYTYIFNIITTCFVHLKYTSTPRLSSGPGDRHSWKMSSFRAAVFSIIVFRRDGWRAGGRSQGHLSPERQISGCQRAGSAFGRRAVKKGKKTRPPLSNKLIKSYPNRRAENLTHSSGLWGEIFRRECSDGRSGEKK